MKLIAIVLSKIFPRRQFCDVEVGDGCVAMNGIFSRQEVADDVISIEDVETFGCYAGVQLWVAQSAMTIGRR